MPLVVLPLRRFPADSLLPGHIPAQLDKCPALGKRLMSTPISAMMVSAVLSPTPGIVSSNATASPTKGSGLLLTSLQICTLTRSSAASNSPSTQRCAGLGRPLLQPSMRPFCCLQSINLILNQSLQHCSPTYSQDVACHFPKFDVARLDHLLDLVGYRNVFFDH